MAATNSRKNYKKKVTQKKTGGELICKKFFFLQKKSVAPTNSRKNYQKKTGRGINLYKFRGDCLCAKCLCAFSGPYKFCMTVRRVVWQGSAVYWECLQMPVSLPPAQHHLTPPRVRPQWLLPRKALSAKRVFFLSTNQERKRHININLFGR